MFHSLHHFKSANNFRCLKTQFACCLTMMSIPKQTKFITYVNLNVCVLCDLPPGRLSDSDANSD